MADKNESTMKWKVDVMQLKAAMQDAKQSISSANAEFKAATAGMDRWQNSTTGLEAKLKQLNATLPQQKTILAQLEKQYEITAKELGTNSTEAQKLKIQIENQKGAIAKTEASIDKYNTQLSQMNSATGKLTQTIADQESELGKLKSAYSNAVIEFGKDSKEAQELAKQIDSLSSELVQNKKALQDANTAADKFDNSLSDVGKTSKNADSDIKNLDKGFTVLKGTMANLAAEAIKGLINGFKKLGKAAVDAVKDVTEMGDEIDKESQKLQISAELYQKLSYAMDKSGSSISDISKGVKNITQTLAKAEAGVEGATEKFDALGISLKNNDGTLKDTETVLMETIDALANMDDETQRSAAANDIFGKSYDELLPLLNEGSEGIHALMQEAEDYGMVMSNDAVKASAKYDDALTKLDGTIKGIKTKMVQQFLPAITRIVDGFSDMANGSDKGAEKVKKGFESIWNKFKTLARKYSPEVAGTFIPVLENIVKALSKVVSFITKNFSKIAPIVMTTVAAFTAFNAAMAITKTVTAVTTAVSGLTAGVGLAAKAQVVWNAALAANPIGAVMTAVVALTTAIIALASSQSEAQKAHEEEMAVLQEQKDLIDESKDSWEELKDAKQKQIDQQTTEWSYYATLKDELADIVDANGKVKHGYEERAAFITGELSNATGKEIEMVDGVIQKYQEVMNSIDQIMEKKRAQIILDAQEDQYKEAILQQGEALQRFMNLQDERQTKTEELQALEKEYEQNRLDYLNATSEYEQQQYLTRAKDIENNIGLKKEELAVIEESYNTQQGLLEQYAYSIGQYENNMALAHAGKYDEMTNVTWNYVKEYESAQDAQKKMVEDRIKQEEANLAILKKLKSEEGTDIYDQQIKQSEKTIAEQKRVLARYTGEIVSGMSDAKVEWKDGLDKQLSELTNSRVLFEDEGRGMVQMYVNGIKVGTPKAKDEMAQMVTQTIYEISEKETDAKIAGMDLIEGVNKGIADESVQNSAFKTVDQFGKKLLKTLKNSLQEQSPSKATEEMGQYLMEGIPLGINKKKNSVLKSVSDAGKSILTAFNAGLSGKSSIGGYGEGKNSLFGRIQSIKSGLAGFNSSMAGSTLINGDTNSESTSNSKNITFNQTINSPKALDSLTIYKETNSMLFAAKVRMNDV